MPDFIIRAWEEELKRDHEDYRVTAPTIEEAAMRLSLLQNQAQQTKLPIVLGEVDGIMALDNDMSDRGRVVSPLEPNRWLGESEMGYMQVDEAGAPIRHLANVPFGEEQLGDPLEIDWHPEGGEAVGIDIEAVEPPD